MAKKAKISIALSVSDALTAKADVLGLGIVEGKKQLSKLVSEVDKQLDGAIRNLIKTEIFTGKAGQTYTLTGNKQTKSGFIVLAGLGKAENLDSQVLRNASAKLANQAISLKAGKIGVAIHDALGSKVDLVQAGTAIAQGLNLGSYRFDEYKSKTDLPAVMKFSVFEADQAVSKELKKGLKAGDITGQAQNYARSIANQPGNVMYPEKFAQEAKKLARQNPNLKCKVFNDRQLCEMGMGGIMAVGQGSAKKPRMIVLQYSPAKGSRNAARIGLVGKAITFDSGGISIKPSAGMDQMKLDKCGGVAVLAAMKALAALKPAVNVTAIICAAENMPGGNSYRPGDIVKTYSGKTVEITNTDAEGRMLLADGLYYANKLKCETIVDAATLTGACVVALGEYKAGLLCNDDALAKKLQKASDTTGEDLWRLPCGEEYLEDMKSEIADLKNSSSTRWGGACTAGAFLSQFVGEAKWAHLDIAGAGMRDTKKLYGGSGAPGFGVRLITEFVMGY